ncbi:MAG: hypothetical protein RJA22_1444 [Verrucomicrobiota bacterium]|jgi:hypothetical protein
MVAGAVAGWLSASPAPAAPTAPAAEAPPTGVYELGYPQVARIGLELEAALPPKARKQVPAQTLLLGQMSLPFVASAPPADKTPPTAVLVSQGFVEFLNRVAHARAHEEAEAGFFARYSTRLSTDAGLTLVANPVLTLPREAWNFQTLNRQASYFNQMAGALVAVDRAHHYLGHYRKHAAALQRGEAAPPPINTLVSESEWRKAVLAGAENALACGLATDGLRTLLASFENMSPRPAWAAYFIHPQANVKKVAKDLVKLERDFFMMDGKMQSMSLSGSPP